MSKEIEETFMDYNGMDKLVTKACSSGVVTIDAMELTDKSQATIQVSPDEAERIALYLIKQAQEVRNG